MRTSPNPFCSSESELPRSSPHLLVPVGSNDHILGDANAPVTLVEYGDYECANCLDAEPIVRALLHYHDRRLRFVFRHFPQNSLHARASLAAQAAEAAGAQGKFWEMHELLFRNRQSLAEAEMTHLALEIGLEIYRFNAELASGEYAARVHADFVSGVQSGVNHTPTFFINGARMTGVRTLNVLSSAVERALQCHA